MPIFTEPTYVYILQLAGGKYYVGLTSRPAKRIPRHFKGSGAKWTKLNPPLAVAYISLGSSELEKQLTLSTMALYGWENVRGYCWTNSTSSFVKPKQLV